MALNGEAPSEDLVACSPLYVHDQSTPDPVSIIIDNSYEEVYIHPDKGPYVYQLNGQPSHMAMKGQPLDKVGRMWGDRQKEWNTAGALKGWADMTSSEQETMLHIVAKKNRGLQNWKGDDFLEAQREMVKDQLTALLAVENVEMDVGGPSQETWEVPVDANLLMEIKNESKVKSKSDAMQLYCPKYKFLGYPIVKVRLRILCFHHAGGAEAIFTQKGSPLMDWAIQTGAVEVIGIDYPGRGKHLKAKRHTSINTLAPDIAMTIYDKINSDKGTPYVVWGHSVGTWVAFEYMMIARKTGMPLPVAAILNAFPAPHMPPIARPWARSAKLNDNGLKDELMKWDMDHFMGPGKVVFDNPGWNDIYGPQIRADFRLFDEYKFQHDGAPRFNFPIHAWHFENEHFIKSEWVQMWQDWTTADFDHHVFKDMGHLTSVYRKEDKAVYFQRVVDVLQAYRHD